MVEERRYADVHLETVAAGADENPRTACIEVTGMGRIYDGKLTTRVLGNRKEPKQRHRQTYFEGLGPNGAYRKSVKNDINLLYNNKFWVKVVLSLISEVFSMKQVSTLFLKLAVIFIGVLVLAFCIFLVPKIGDFAGELYPNVAYLKSLVLIDMYAAAIPFYFALSLALH